MKKEDREMKTKSLAHKGLYIGAGAGLLLFAFFGLLPSVFIGGVLGLKLAVQIFGAPLGVAILPRMIVGASMVLGILVASLVFIVGTGLVGWLFGHLVDAVRATKATQIDLNAKSTKA